MDKKITKDGLGQESLLGKAFNEISAQFQEPR